MPVKRNEPRGLTRRIANILGLRENYISAALNGNTQVSEARAKQIANAKIQARQEIETEQKLRAAKKAERLQMLQKI